MTVLNTVGNDDNLARWKNPVRFDLASLQEKRHSRLLKLNISSKLFGTRRDEIAARRKHVQNEDLIGTGTDALRHPCSHIPNFTGIARSFSNSAAPAPTVKFHSAAVARSAGMGRLTRRQDPQGLRDLWGRLPAPRPGGQIGHPLEAELVRARPVQEQQAGVGRRGVKHLLIAEVDDLGQVAAAGQQLAQRLAVLGVEELVRQDEAEPARGLAGSAPAPRTRRRFVVALARGRIGALVVFHLQRRPLLHASGCGCRVGCRRWRRSR